MKSSYKGFEINVIDGEVKYKRLVEERGRFYKQDGVVTMLGNQIMFHCLKKKICSEREFIHFKISLNYNQSMNQEVLKSLIPDSQKIFIYPKSLETI